MSFINNLNDTYELLNKLDDVIMKNVDNNLVKKQLLSVTEDLARMVSFSSWGTFVCSWLLAPSAQAPPDSPKSSTSCLDSFKALCASASALARVSCRSRSSINALICWDPATNKSKALKILTSTILSMKCKW